MTALNKESSVVILRTLLVATAILTPSAPSVAEQILRTAGPWTAYSFIDTRGSEVCGVRTTWNDGRRFSIGRWEGESQLVVQATNPAWNINATTVPVVMEIDDETYRAQALVLGNRAGVEFHVPFNQIDDFTTNFAEAALAILYMGANRIRWAIDLSRTAEVTSSFGRCIRRMSR